MTVNVEYIRYRPAGYTDDLGIIADRNQWVPEQPEGWYVYCSPHMMSEIMDWLTENNIEYDMYFYQFVLVRKSDAILLKLRWS